MQNKAPSLVKHMKITFLLFFKYSPKSPFSLTMPNNFVESFYFLVCFVRISLTHSLSKVYLSLMEGTQKKGLVAVEGDKDLIF
jgi:hypothetical protein